VATPQTKQFHQTPPLRISRATGRLTYFPKDRRRDHTRLNDGDANAKNLHFRARRSLKASNANLEEAYGA
jgi:hypothetical protein